MNIKTIDIKLNEEEANYLLKVWQYVSDDSWHGHTPWKNSMSHIGYKLWKQLYEVNKK